MGYQHVEIAESLGPKKFDSPCGDHMGCLRAPEATTLALADGLGSGVKANLYARWCVTRILGLIQRGFSIREAFARVARTMNDARQSDQPFAAFVILQTLNDGATTVLSYDMPMPLLVDQAHAGVLPARTGVLGPAPIAESACHLGRGEGVLLVTDGVTQAGMDTGLRGGWRERGVCSFLNELLRRKTDLQRLPQLVRDRATELWGHSRGDDCSAVLAWCRRGVTLNLMTGPPVDRRQDEAVARRFMDQPGWKAICGGATAEMVARVLRLELVMELRDSGAIAPPQSHMPGVDLVTEGSVTLNQVYNILDEEAPDFPEENGVTELYYRLRSADRVVIFLGQAGNPASGDIVFRQRGILTRNRIVPLIADKLRQAGKLVQTETF